MFGIGFVLGTVRVMVLAPALGEWGATFAELPVFLDVVAAVSCLAGAVLAVYGWWTWKRYERALRTGAPLPAPVALPVLAGGVVVMALLLAGYAVASAL